MNDGWNLEEKMPNLESVLDDIDRLTYELRNCVRGCSTDCHTYAELGEYIQDLAERLKNEGEDIAEMEEDPEDEE